MSNWFCFYILNPTQLDEINIGSYDHWAIGYFSRNTSVSKCTGSRIAKLQWRVLRRSQSAKERQKCQIARETAEAALQLTGQWRSLTAIDVTIWVSMSVTLFCSYCFREISGVSYRMSSLKAQKRRNLHCQLPILHNLMSLLIISDEHCCCGFSRVVQIVSSFWTSWPTTAL